MTHLLPALLVLFRVMGLYHDLIAVGIAPENLPYVFVPFFTTKQANHGIGLGLSISKNIVDGHGGAIRVESAFGQGTQFVIELPVR